MIMAAFGEEVIEPNDFVGGDDFGEHEGGGWGVGGEYGLDVGEANGRAQTVDAHDAFNAVISLGLFKEGEGFFSRFVFVFGGDAVFEFDADDVGAGGERFGVEFRPEAGGEDEGAAGADVVFSHLEYLLWYGVYLLVMLLNIEGAGFLVIKKING